MPDEHTLMLRQADQARTDFALIEDQLEFIMGQLARVPTRAYLCRMLLLATASVWALRVTVTMSPGAAGCSSIVAVGAAHDAWTAAGSTAKVKRSVPATSDVRVIRRSCLTGLRWHSSSAQARR